MCCTTFQLKLDGKQIGTREFWKRQIIVAHRHSEPASYGFYYPAREEGNEEESCNRKKVSSHKSTHSTLAHMHAYTVLFSLACIEPFRDSELGKNVETKQNSSQFVGHCGVTVLVNVSAMHMWHSASLFVSFQHLGLFCLINNYCKLIVLF